VTNGPAATVEGGASSALTVAAAAGPVTLSAVLCLGTVDAAEQPARDTATNSAKTGKGREATTL
jgi:hypothetical protein